jgi:CheY-like chemotaxis protein
VRILLIEDSPNHVKVLTEALTDIGQGIHVMQAGSRDSALVAIKEAHFDVAVCDLKIPTVDGGLDAETIHGKDVVNHLRRELPGTPIIINSAYGDDEFRDDLISQGSRLDIFGGGDQPILQYTTKGILSRLTEKVRVLYEDLEVLDSIDIRQEGIQLSPPQKRVLRIFGRRNGGSVVTVSPMAAGLSSSIVLRVQVLAPTRASAANTVAKLGSVRDVEDERERYQRNAPARLSHGSFTPLADIVQAGAQQSGGLFYTVAEDYRSVFEVLRAQPAEAAPVVARLRERMRPWWQGAPFEQRSVSIIRRELAPDVQDDLIQPGWLEAERISLQTCRCPVHGDLHGGNVLVDAEGHPVLIDFGRCGTGDAALDPVTLELSLLFHPGADDLRHDWATPERASHWSDLDEYAIGSPLEAFIRACREWAHEVAAGRREINANAYGYAVRQLQYADTNQALAVAVANSATQDLRE